MKYYLLTISIVFAELLSGCTVSTHLDSTSWIASTAVASVIAAALSSLFNLLIKDKEYKNDYYKKVIDKRIKAIEALEIYVSLFNTVRDVINTNNNQHYLIHTFFVDKRNEEAAHKALEDITKSGIWYSIETTKRANRLTRIVGREVTKCAGKNNAEITGSAIQVFRELEIAKMEVQQSMRNDMASLHKVDDFFKAKALASRNKTAAEIVDEEAKVAHPATGNAASISSQLEKHSEAPTNGRLGV